MRYYAENTEYQDKVRFLFQVPLLKRLPLDQQPLVAKAAKSIKFQPHSIIMREGDLGDDFYVLRQGEASVTVRTVKGEKAAFTSPFFTWLEDWGQVITLARKPSLRMRLGISCITARFQHEARTATITTQTFVECLRFIRNQQGHGEASDFPLSCKVHPPTDKTEAEKTFIREALLNSETLNGGMSAMSEEKMTKLTDAMWKEKVMPGRRLIREGDLGAESFYIIESGKKTVVDVLRRGHTFGELAILFLVPRRATVICTSEANVWVVDRHQFKQIIMPISEEKRLEYVKIFSTVPLLMPLLTQEKTDMANVIVDVMFNSEEIIVEQGAPGNTFFILVEGKVAVIKDGLIAGELEANAAKNTMPYFGERALLYQEPRAATVRVVSESARCLMLDKEAFDEHLGLLKEVLENGLKSLTGLAPLRHMSYTRDPERESRQLGRSTHVDKILHKELVQCGRFGCHPAGKHGGGYSTVDLVQHAETGNTYALKSISKGYIAAAHMKAAIANEKDVLYMTSSPFIIKLFETYNLKSTLCFLLEAALGGELFTTYKKHAFFGSEPHTRYYMAGVAHALEHMHDRRVIYRDLKPENLLLDHKGCLKLTDMGSAKFASGSTYTIVGTPDYFAPEMVKASGHDCALDWWSFGVLIFELMAGKPPFESAYPFQTFAKIERGIEKVRFPAAMIGSVEELVKVRLGRKVAQGLGFRV
ncbi:for [Symbiodinium natans]|uniref:cGMP-dependent protein kinase n=1 Tax=Symbiodinium natans TaxID=878477 RepID=A0A812UGQ3_9DINO|nr:for [Symbiodinium natans]